MNESRRTSLVAAAALGVTAAISAWLWLDRDVELAAPVFWGTASVAAACLQFALVHARTAHPSWSTVGWIVLLGIGGLVVAAGSAVGAVRSPAFMPPVGVPASTRTHFILLLASAVAGLVWAAGAGLLFVVELVRAVRWPAPRPGAR